jgi:hypothetical protein
MRVLSLIIFLTVLSYIPAKAQGDIDTEEKVIFRNEWSIGTIVKTNGLEFDYRSGKFVNIYRKKLYDFGIGFIKHPQQYRATNPYISGYSAYCFGKKNFCFELFYSLGRQRTLFQKADLNSVEVRLFYFGGATLAFLKPIYYQIYYSSYDIRKEKFDPINHYATITLGPAEFSKGFNELKVVPGINAKAGVSIEFGKKDTRLCAMEAGAKVSAYAKKLDIMGQEKNPQIICSLFLTFRFGRVKYGAQFEYLNDYGK